jgi:hypothetical protein
LLLFSSFDFPPIAAMDNGKVLKSTFRFPLGAACAAIKRRWRDDFAAQAAPKVGIGLLI